MTYNKSDEQRFPGFPVAIREDRDREPFIAATPAEAGRWLASYDAQPCVIEERTMKDNWGCTYTIWEVYRVPHRGPRVMVGRAATSEDRALEDVWFTARNRGFERWTKNDNLKVDTIDEVRTLIELVDGDWPADAVERERRVLRLLEEAERFPGIQAKATGGDAE